MTNVYLSDDEDEDENNENNGVENDVEMREGIDGRKKRGFNMIFNPDNKN